MSTSEELLQEIRSAATKIGQVLSFIKPPFIKQRSRLIVPKDEVGTIFT